MMCEAREASRDLAAEKEVEEEDEGADMVTFLFQSAVRM
jgi:hypothetical protein